MHIQRFYRACLVLVAAMASVMLLSGPASARVEGITGTSFNFEARAGTIQTGEGRSVFILGFADTDGAGAGHVQYPGPTLLISEGDTVTITLTNALVDPPYNFNVSMAFPGMDAVGVVDDGNPADEVQGLLGWEVLPGGSATYTFTASHAGTYYYQSVTDPDVQVDMGLFGAIIVYPPEVLEPGSPLDGRAYSAADDPTGESVFDREFLFLVSEMDDDIHDGVRFGRPVDTTGYFPVYWFINGRTGPDTLLPEGTSILRRQPYNCLPRMHPGERVLLRFIGIGRDMHPYHTHGNHMRIFARNGRILESSAGAGDLSQQVFTITTSPGETADAIFEWTGEGLGFDVYGPDHGALLPSEDATYHGVPIPTPVPDRELLTFGDFFEGSPYLGGGGELPPGVGGFNPNMAYTFMWHSHNEKEMVNNNVFPGGMMTLMFVEHPAVEIDPANP